MKIKKSSSHRLGFQVELVFQLTQHSRDEQLMISLIEYFGACGRRGGCGKVYFKREVIDFQVTEFSDLTEIVIPFFTKYPIVGEKSSDFQDFCKVADLMKENKHLTQFGLEQIIKIKAGMNRKRIILLESSIGLQFLYRSLPCLVKKIFFSVYSFLLERYLVLLKFILFFIMLKVQK